jgi:hypothetical protein
MARDTAEFAQQNGERAMQAANFGMSWVREFTEESLGHSKQAFDGFLKASRKMAEDFETQAAAIREHTAALAEKTMANSFDFGEKLARAKEPQEFAQCQSEFFARQAQTIADQTKEFGQKMQKAAQEMAQTTSSAMAEAGRRAESGQNAVAAATSRAEQSSRRPQQRADA